MLCFDKEKTYSGDTWLAEWLGDVSARHYFTPTVYTTSKHGNITQWYKITWKAKKTPAYKLTFHKIGLRITSSVDYKTG